MTTMTTTVADVCGHTHLYSGLAPLGMPAPELAPESFVQILERVWWRLDRALDEASLYASAKYYAAQALLAGTTTLIDHHESPNFVEGSLDVIADACAEVGVRVLVCYGATERNGGREEARRGLAECRRFVLANKRPNVVGVVALHASFTVSDETVSEAGRMCADLGVPMHVHLAEDAADVVDAKRRGYAGPLERLTQLGALPAGSIIAHGVHLSAEQVARASDAGLWFVHNPRSNEGNRVGYAKTLRVSDRVALGTDGWNADMAQEEAALVRLATAHGDDLAAAARRRPTSRPMAEALFGASLRDDRVTRGPDGAVQTVVSGRLELVSGGRIVRCNHDEIDALARREAARLWDRMRGL